MAGAYRLETQDGLPEMLHIQMDNTCHESKNKFTLTFAAILVEWGVFRKRYLGLDLTDPRFILDSYQLDILMRT